MKNIKKELEKAEKDKQELERALNMVLGKIESLEKEASKCKNEISKFEKDILNIAPSELKKLLDFLKCNLELSIEHGIIRNSWHLDEFPYNTGAILKFKDIWTIENHFRYGGYEGAGEEHYIIVKVTHLGSESYYKVPGYYASYDGSHLDWDYITRVEPVQKLVTFWE